MGGFLFVRLFVCVIPCANKETEVSRVEICGKCSLVAKPDGLDSDSGG